MEDIQLKGNEYPVAKSKLTAFHYDMVIEAENQQQADRVMAERIYHNEDLREYGVGDYTIDASPADGREPDPIEVGPDSDEDDAEDRPVVPGFERHGAVAGVNEDEYRSIMRINAAIEGSYTLPSAERVYTGDGTPLLEFAYRRADGWLHVRVKTDGSFHSADVARGKDLEDLTSGPLYDTITAALAPEPTA